MQSEPINEIIEPESISFWPPQPGWYIILVIVLVLVFVFIWKRYQKWVKNEYRRKAVASINALSETDVNLSFELNRVLKIVALNSYGRSVVADLYGDKWLAFLSEADKGIQFTEYPLSLIGNSQYRSKDTQDLSTSDIDLLKRSAIRWIKSH